MADGATAILENMMVRLMGDSSSYTRMLAEAQAQTQMAARNIESATARIESLSTGLQGFAQQALSVLSSFGVATSLKASFDKFSTFEQQQIRLKAAIESSGRTAAAVLPDYSAFTDEITAATLATRTAVTALIVRGEQMGLSAEKTKNIVRYSVALAAALGGEADGYFRASMAIADNNYEMAARMMGLRGMKDHEEAAHRVQAVLSAGFKTQSELLNTASGQLTKLQISLAGLSREVGGMVADAIRPFIVGLRQVVSWITTVDPAIKKAAVTVIALMGAFLAAGPILAAFKGIAGMVLSAVLSPLGLIVTTLSIVAVKVQQWADSVGGAAQAWEIVRARIVEIKDMALGWLGDFISEHQRLTLAIVLVGGVLVTLVAAYRLLAFTVATVDGLLSLLYIKQAAQRVALLAWAAALRAVHISLLLLGGIMGAAMWLGSLVASTAALAVQTAAWLVWRGTILAAQTALAVFHGVVSGVRTALQLLGFALLVLEKGTSAALGTLAAATTAANTVADWLWVAALLAVTAAMSVLNVALAAGTVLEAIFTLGISLLLAVLITLAAVVFVVVGAWGLWHLAVWATTAALTWTAAAAMAAATAIASAAATAVAAWTPVVLLFGGAIAASVAAASAALGGFLDVLLALPGRSGILATLGGMFRQWSGYLMDVYHAMTLGKVAIAEAKDQAGQLDESIRGISTGAQLAWKLFTTAFQIAMRQVLLAWPEVLSFLNASMRGLLDVLQAGWEAFSLSIKPPLLLAWEGLWVTAKAKLFTILQDMYLGLQQFFLNIISLAGPAGESVNAAMSGDVAKVKEKRTSFLDAIRNGWNALAVASSKAREEQARFADHPAYAGMEDDIKRAAEAMDRLNAAIAAQKERIARDAAAAGKKIEEVWAQDPVLQQLYQQYQQLQAFTAAAVEQQKKDEDALAAPYGKAEKEIKKFDAAIIGSAEAYAHVAEYMERLSDESGGPLGKGHHGKTEAMKPHAPEAIAPPEAPRPIEPARPPAFDDRVPTKLDLIATILAAIRDQKNGKGRVPVPAAL